MTESGGPQDAGRGAGHANGGHTNGNGHPTGNGRPSILITGVTGGLAGLLIDRLGQEYRLVGVDPRPLPRDRAFPGEFHQLNYTHRKLAEVFRKNRFHAVIHLGRIPDRRPTSSLSYNTNVLGTDNLLEQARLHGVKNVIVFSTFHVYGAHPLNHAYITENEPLRASQLFQELADAVELDHVASTFLWRHRDVRTVVLRPANVIGAKIHNTISSFLRSEYCPTLLGYDPLFQFVHETDITEALYRALQGKSAGIYNVAGEGVIPFSRAVRLSGAKSVPIPTFFAYPLVDTLKRIGVQVPRYMIDFFRYGTIVSDEAFRRDFDYQPKVTTVEALRSLRVSRLMGPSPAERALRAGR